MKLGKMPPGIRSTFERWAASRKATELSFVPNGEGALDLKLNGRLLGCMWVEGDELHLNPVRHVAISKHELKNLVAEALREMP